MSKSEETQPESADEAVVAPEETEVVAESSDPVRPAQTNRAGALLSLTLSIVAIAVVGVGGWLGWTEVQTI